MWFVSKTDSIVISGFLGASIGMATGAVGLPAAHELTHRTNKIFQNMGLIILLICFYGHFKIEHIHGHHLRVATKSDPATARFGENIYTFLIRCVLNGWRSAWKTEHKLLVVKGTPLISYKNRMLFYSFLQLMLLACTWLIFSFNGLMFLAAHTVISILLLETVEYIQHYGLQRKKINDSEYEPFKEIHAWNSPHCATNWSTFNLGLHSAHHSKSGKTFPLLSSQTKLMEMPTGYPIMIILALIPPMWFKVMNSKLNNIK